LEDAGKLALGFFARDVAVEWKHDVSPVAAADKSAERLFSGSQLHPLTPLRCVRGFDGILSGASELGFTASLGPGLPRP